MIRWTAWHGTLYIKNNEKLQQSTMITLNFELKILGSFFASEENGKWRENIFSSENNSGFQNRRHGPWCKAWCTSMVNGETMGNESTAASTSCHCQSRPRFLVTLLFEKLIRTKKDKDSSICLKEWHRHRLHLPRRPLPHHCFLAFIRFTSQKP
jgi:hypothetical protein